MDKRQLRQLMRSRLVELTEQQLQDKSKAACDNLIKLPEFKKSNVVMAYLSLPHEVNTSGAILYSWQHRKTIAVPKISWQQRHMIPVEIHSLETGFSAEASGLRNPITGVPVLIEDIDIVITPGLGFDKNGNRLGRGGAYYDRFFKNKTLRAIKCGFAFSEQVVDEIPVAEHDEKIDILITDEGITYTNGKNQGG